MVPFGCLHTIGIASPLSLCTPRFFLKVAHSDISGSLQMSPLAPFFFSGFLTQKIFLAHFGLLVVLHIVIASLSHGRFVFLECFVFSLRLELGYLFPISLSVDGLHVHHPVHSCFRPHPVLSVLFQFFGLLVRGRETSTARYTLGPKHVIYEKSSWRRLHIHVVVTQSSPCCCGNKCD